MLAFNSNLNHVEFTHTPLTVSEEKEELAGYKLNIRGLPDFFAQTPNAVTSNRQGAFAFHVRDCHSLRLGLLEMSSDVVIRETK